MIENDPTSVSSPPCLMHEFADELVPPPASDPQTGVSDPSDWSAVKRWRAATRSALLAWRTALEPHDRRLRGDRAKAHLLATTALSTDTVLGIYWPIRGEIDARDVAARHVAAGGIAALPVVTHRHAPVEFWRWEPGMSMRRGFWNIPIPATRDVVRPEALLIPLVGFDAAGFRLGYGGGYYDRTLAASMPRPLCIGIGYARSALPTIYPQTHDVPMSLIVTDGGVHEAKPVTGATMPGLCFSITGR